MADAAQQFTNTAIPDAFGIGQQQDAAKLAYSNTLTKLNAQRQSLARNSGYNVQFDPTTGHITSMNVDGSNPYGGYQQMLRGAAQSDQQAQFGAQERGLHGGLANQAQAQSHYQNQGDLTNFGSGLLDQMNGLEDQQRSAGTDYNNSLYTLEQQAAQNAILKGLFNQTDYSGLTYAPYSDTTPPDNTGSPYHPNGSLSPDTTQSSTAAQKAAAKYIADATKAAKANPNIYVHSPGLAASAPAVKKAIAAAKPKSNKAR